MANPSTKDIIGFSVKGKVYFVPRVRIPKGSLLELLMTTNFNKALDDQGNFIIGGLAIEDADIVFDYLNKGIPPKSENLDVFDYLQIDFLASYESALLHEEYMRERMYSPGYEADPINTDPYYGLIKIDEAFWSQLVVKGNDNNSSTDNNANTNNSSTDNNANTNNSSTNNINNTNEIRDNLLFNRTKLVKAPWKEIEKRLATLRNLFVADNIFVAGGTIFSILFGLKINDIDLFLYNTTPEEAKKKILAFEQMLLAPRLEESRRFMNKYQNVDTDISDKVMGSNSVGISDKVMDNPLDIINNSKDNLLPGQTPLVRRSLQNHGIKAYSKLLYDKINSHRTVGLPHPFGSGFTQLLRTTFSNDDKEFVEAYGTNFMSAKAVYDKLAELYGKHGELLVRPLGEGYDITRSANAITYRCSSNREEYQFVLRLYHSPSEIIHGFDVDSCCLGYDGKNIWATERAIYALINGYNTVNFNRLSPSYENRLAKYGIRGMAVKIPNFTKDKIKLEEIIGTREDLGDIKDVKPKHPWYSKKRQYPPLERYNYVKQLRGLDILLYLDYDFEHKRLRYIGDTLKALCQESSDYAAIPYCYYGGIQAGIAISDLLQYLYDSKDRYPQYSEKYLPYLKNYLYDDDDYREEVSHGLATYELSTYNNFYVNNILHTRDIFVFKFTRSDLTLLEKVWEIPEDIYDCLGTLRKWRLPRVTEFKVTNPGEQMTNTFHKLTLEDNDIWYKGLFYDF